MPFYEYRCADCAHTKDHLLKFSETVAACPACGSTHYARQLSKPADPQFKGTGFYATDFKPRS